MDGNAVFQGTSHKRTDIVNGNYDSRISLSIEDPVFLVVVGILHGGWCKHDTRHYYHASLDGECLTPLGGAACAHTFVTMSSSN